MKFVRTSVVVCCISRFYEEAKKDRKTFENRRETERGAYKDEGEEPGG